MRSVRSNFNRQRVVGKTGVVRQCPAVVRGRTGGELICRIRSLALLLADTRGAHGRFVLFLLLILWSWRESGMRRRTLSPCFLSPPGADAPFPWTHEQRHTYGMGRPRKGENNKNSYHDLYGRLRAGDFWEQGRTQNDLVSSFRRLFCSIIMDFSKLPTGK
jgi:hypothetical protein